MLLWPNVRCNAFAIPEATCLSALTLPHGCAGNLCNFSSDLSKAHAILANDSKLKRYKNESDDEKFIKNHLTYAQLDKA